MEKFDLIDKLLMDSTNHPTFSLNQKFIEGLKNIPLENKKKKFNFNILFDWIPTITFNWGVNYRYAYAYSFVILVLGIFGFNYYTNTQTQITYNFEEDIKSIATIYQAENNLIENSNSINLISYNNENNKPVMKTFAIQEDNVYAVKSDIKVEKIFEKIKDDIVYAIESENDINSLEKEINNIIINN